VHECGYRTACLATIQIAWASSRLSKRFPRSARWAWPTPDSTFPFRSDLDPTGQGYSAIVRQDVAIERIQSGIIDVRDEHALAQIIQDDDRVAPPSRRNAFSCNSPRCANWNGRSESVPPCGYSPAPSRTVGYVDIFWSAHPGHCARTVVHLDSSPGPVRITARGCSGCFPRNLRT